MPSCRFSRPRCNQESTARTRTDVPAENFFAGYGILFVFVILIGVIALLVAGDRVRLPLK